MEWKKAAMLCLDTETTGLEPGKDRIVEVGAVRYRDGEVLQRDSWLVNPGRSIPKEASDLHGITDDVVKFAPRIEDIAETLLSLVCEAQVLVGYNWPFDASFFQAELGLPWTDSIEGTPIIDPLVVVRFKRVGKFWPGKGRHRLENVAERFDIEPEGDVHRASTDCMLTLRILELMMKHLPNDGAQAADVIVRRRKEQDADYQRWLSRQPKRD